ncbi:MAG TPA: hypothetical protein VE988_16915 [Gemmataceae bacterium]|nr:hypothetical protein [Gemmataceae bacterium]
MPRRLVSNGYFWLLFLSVGLFIYNYQRPWEHCRLWPDSYNYLDMACMDLTDPKGLATFRTWGYPLLLKLYQLVFLNPEINHAWTISDGPKDYAWVLDHAAVELTPNHWLAFDDPWAYLPECQLVLHIISVLVFYRGLRELCFSATAAVLMCLPVLIYDYIDMNTYSLLADAPGQAFLLFTVTSFFFVLRRPTRALRWLALGLCVFASYHIRAAFQFLLVMLPLATIILGSCAAASNAKKQRLAMTAVMVVICWLPYLAYCGWRHHVVGQFSLVAYTGFNFFGLCGQLFTVQMLPEVRDECKPLAEAIIKGREADEHQDTLRSWTRGMWYKQSHGWIPPLPHGRPVHELDYDRIQDQYSWLVWRVLWGWVISETSYSGDTVALDKLLLSFSLDFIKHHPDIYLMVVLKGWRAALEFAALRWATRVPLLLFGEMLLIALAVRLAKGPAPAERIKPTPGELSERRRTAVFTLTVILFFVLKTQLATMVVAIMMVWDIDGRYPDTASLMLPCLAMLGFYGLGCYVVRALRGNNLRLNPPETTPTAKDAADSSSKAPALPAFPAHI